MAWMNIKIKQTFRDAESEPLDEQEYDVHGALPGEIDEKRLKPDAELPPVQIFF